MRWYIGNRERRDYYRVERIYIFIPMSVKYWGEIKVNVTKIYYIIIQWQTISGSFNKINVISEGLTRVL